MRMLAAALSTIPSHKERALSRVDLIRRFCASSEVTSEQAGLALDLTLEVLRLFHLCQESEGHYSLGGQTQTYCRNALLWFVQNNQSLLANWERHGTAREELPLINILEQAPYFLKAVEERRRELSTRKALPLVASREQPCSVVVFKAVHKGKTYLLHQWDQKSERYQLIGGKQRTGEVAEETAVREAMEEVPRTQLILGKNFFLTKAPLKCMEEWEVSRTYGALTHYKIDVFSARLEMAQFSTSESDLWISMEEMLAGHTFANALIAPVSCKIARDHRGFLDSLAPAMDFGPQLPVSERLEPPAPKHMHSAEPEIPEHLSIGWFLRLIRTVSLHELALLGSLMVASLGGCFALGRQYESYAAKQLTVVAPQTLNTSPDFKSEGEAKK